MRSPISHSLSSSKSNLVSELRNSPPRSLSQARCRRSSTSAERFPGARGQATSASPARSSQAQVFRGGASLSRAVAVVGDPAPPPVPCGCSLLRLQDFLRGDGPPHRSGTTSAPLCADLGKASELLITSWVGSGDQDVAAGDRRRSHLKLFKADMDEEGSYDEAMKGCVGVFHVAASMEFNFPPGTTDLESHVRSNVLEPAVRRTINVLRSCQKAGTVRRVVFTSSVSTITARGVSGEWIKPVVDESSLVSVDAIWKKKPDGWVYVLSKVLSEEAAFRYAKENGIDLVSVVPPTVAGPFFTPKVPASVRVLLSPITNDPELYSILLAVHSRLGSIPLVHIEDICNAHIFLMEEEAAEGRYICSAGSCVMPRLAHLLSNSDQYYPSFTNSPSQRFNKDKFQDSLPPVISSNRLLDLGFVFKYAEIRDIVKQSVDCCLDRGFLISEGS